MYIIDCRGYIIDPGREGEEAQIPQTHRGVEDLRLLEHLAVACFTVQSIYYRKNVANMHACRRGLQIEAGTAKPLGPGSHRHIFFNHKRAPKLSLAYIPMSA